MIDKNKVRSLRDRLKAASQNSNSPLPAVVTDFLIERIVFRLARNSSLKDHLIFKGGYVGLRCYESPRYTTDLDAIAYMKSEAEVLAHIKEAMDTDLNDLVWFEFEKEIDLQGQNEYGGSRLQYRAGIGEKPFDVKKAQILKIDIGVGDPVTPGPVTIRLDEKLGQESILWRVYNIETIVAEKMHCLISRSADNSRSKDIFDLAFYLPQCQMATLKEALEKTFSHRGDEIPPSIHTEITTVNKPLLKRGWNTATGLLVPKPDFEQCFKAIEDWFKDNADIFG